LDREGIVHIPDIDDLALPRDNGDAEQVAGHLRERGDVIGILTTLVRFEFGVRLLGHLFKRLDGGQCRLGERGGKLHSEEET